MTTLMTWKEICEDPQLQDLPYKVETDRFGRIVMSPANNRHSVDQTAIARLLSRERPDWVIAVEFAIDTAEGVKVPDVIAMPPERHPDLDNYVSCPLAPDVCVEVHSPSTPAAQLEETRRLLAAKGCAEFWVCAGDGTMSFQDGPSGARLDRSRLFPNFPSSVRGG